MQNLCEPGGLRLTIQSEGRSNGLGHLHCCKYLFLVSFRSSCFSLFFALSSYTASQVDFFFSLMVNSCSSNSTNGAIIVYWCQRLWVDLPPSLVQVYLWWCWYGCGFHCDHQSSCSFERMYDILELSVILTSLAVVYMDTSLQIYMALPHRSFCY